MPVAQTRIAKQPAPDVKRWAQLYANAAKVAYIRLPVPQRYLFVKLAALTALVGDTKDEEAKGVYYALSCLFFSQNRIPRWPMAIDAIPPNKDTLLRVTACVKAYGEYADPKGNWPLKRSNITLDRVVKVMTEVEEPEIYVKHLVGDGFLRPSAIFHPNTLTNMKKKLRGALSVTGGRLRKDHMKQVREKVRVVTS